MTGVPYSMLCHSNQAPNALFAYYASNISDNSSYVERMCLLLSSANLPVDTGKIIVGVKSITGNKIKTVDITSLSIWAILLALYKTKANYIHIDDLYNTAN